MKKIIVPLFGNSNCWDGTPEFKKAEMKHAVVRNLGRHCPEEAVNQPLEVEGVSTGF
ncbi:hypothetical protein [Sporosarcina sp. SAFN-015]|uniref:hypothetical protein n=1 Tax=Sporosarcina sp. SAFN-015 TaxID=3387274 RepID=UPI003F7F0955